MVSRGRTGVARCESAATVFQGVVRWGQSGPDSGDLTRGSREGGGAVAPRYISGRATVDLVAALGGYGILLNEE